MMLAALGDSAVVVNFGTDGVETGSLRARRLAEALARDRPRDVADVVVAYATVAIHFHRSVDARYAEACAEVARRVAAWAANEEAPTDAAGTSSTRLMEIPVDYGGDAGPDLAEVAARAGLSEEAVVARHSGAAYEVEAIGFTPGFPYLAGLPAELATPRRATPRLTVPAGSVAIGGAQTGIYPQGSPGGWNLLGRTTLALFDPHRAEPALLRVGDTVKFRAIVTPAPGSPAPKNPKDDDGNDRDIRHLLDDNGHESAICNKPICHLLDDKTVLTATDRGVAGGGDEHTRRGDAGRGGVGACAEAATGCRVWRAGGLTTVQDLGRAGWRAAGVAVGGAADEAALRLANALVGNPEDAAGLEFTLVGPELEFLNATLVAVTGGDFGGLERGVPTRVAADTRISFGPARAGARGYLAVAGGFTVAPVLGSRSTDLRGRFGGFAGRALRRGDVVPTAAATREIVGRWRLDPRILPAHPAAPTVRVVRGAQAGEFGDAWSEEVFEVTVQADRMGVRLRGTKLARSGGAEPRSSPVAPGTVQVPPDGQPIVLLADAQTIGGYPQLAHVIGADLPVVAQLRPGDTLRFREVSLEDAHAAWRARARAWGILREGLAGKIVGGREARP